MNDRASSQDPLERAKLWMDVLSPIAGVMIAIVLMLNLGTISKFVRTQLSTPETKVTKFSVLGFEVDFEDFTQKTQGALANSNDTLTRLNSHLSCISRNNCSQDEISQIRALIDNPSLTAGVSQLISQSKAVSAQLANAAVTATQSSSAAPDWVAVISADTDPSLAKYEVRRANSHGYTAEVVHRGNWLRTVVHFPSQTAANDAVPALAGMTERPPYVRDLSQWCRPQPPTTSDNFRVCGTTGSPD